MKWRVGSAGVVAIVVVVYWAAMALAAGGDLDTTFSGDGKVTTNFTTSVDVARSVAIQGDGKIVAAGDARFGRTFALARYNADGTLDATFSGDGKVTTNFTAYEDEATALAIQTDGKIVTAGFAGRRFALARYNSDGTLDISFGGDGKVTTDFTPDYDFASGVAIQDDGKIVAAGTAGIDRFALARYNSDGTLDISFGGDGKVTTNFTPEDDIAFGVATQTDEKIVAGGYAGAEGWFALARYNPDGSLDTTFSGDGKVTTNFTRDADVAYGVAIEDDGKIVAAGGAGYYPFSAKEKFALARYNSDGTLDISFGGDGKVTTDFWAYVDDASSVAIDADGKIVAAGYARGGFALARYLAS